MSVIESRAADHREQRFGSPANVHLFALVRCSAPEAPLDLVVPIVDVPLICWYFDGQSATTSIASVSAPVSKKRGWLLAATGGGLLFASAVAAAESPSHRWMSAFTWAGWLLLLNGITILGRARRHKRRSAGSPQ